MTDLTGREIAVVAPLLALMLVIGLYPKPLYDRVTPSIEQVLTTLDGEVAAAAAAANTATSTPTQADSE
jgi:NADH-quinone oxidoreductase subunit M